VTTLAAIIAIAAVGEALVILTKNIDLSVESTIGVVAFVVGLILKEQASRFRRRGRSGSGSGSRWGWPTA
jgi:ribose/xylose/arabinose/galactoside ABC-type transport system permease subunit